MTVSAEKRRRIVWVFPGFGVGGAQMRFAAIANHFGPASTHVIVSLNGDLSCRTRLAEDLNLEFPDLGHRPGHMGASIRQAHQVLRAQKPDLVVTSNWGAIEWAIGAKLARLPHLHTEDGFGPEERDSQIRRRVLTRRLALRHSVVVLPSITLATLARQTWRLPPGQLRYIPNGIDVARFATAAPASLPGGDGPVIGTIAALRPEKNIARLIKAFAALRALRPARLVIVGDGPERVALENLAQELGLGLGGDVFFAGHSMQPECWHARFDIFALSSDTEQMPLSLLEAMAARRAALCTDVGDVRSMLASANNDYITPASDVSFTEALTRILDADLPEIGSANHKKAESQYDQKAMFAAYGNLLGQ